MKKSSLLAAVTAIALAASALEASETAFRGSMSIPTTDMAMSAIKALRAANATKLDYQLKLNESLGEKLGINKTYKSGTQKAGIQKVAPDDGNGEPIIIDGTNPFWWDKRTVPLEYGYRLHTERYHPIYPGWQTPSDLPLVDPVFDPSWITTPLVTQFSPLKGMTLPHYGRG